MMILTVIVFLAICVPFAYATSFATLHLNTIGGHIEEGQDVTFTGKLTSIGGNPIVNRTIFVLDDTAYTRPDIILTTTTTDFNGEFSATWKAIPKDNGSPFHFYAKFIGGKTFGYTRSEVYESVLENSDKLSTDVIPWKTMPVWFKNGSQMWSNGKIRDEEYSFSIQNLINYGIVKTNASVGDGLKIPTWLKKDANMFSNDQISEDAYTNTLEYLLDGKIIRL
ncbi:MAG TPA: hypothetical protein VFX64_00625 [Candidatus Nitrosotalea sp.]|nr:hypothetical protein [Candidatus Nitrosotalea sp.]